MPSRCLYLGYCLDKSLVEVLFFMKVGKVSGLCPRTISEHSGIDRYEVESIFASKQILLIFRSLLDIQNVVKFVKLLLKHYSI